MKWTCDPVTPLAPSRRHQRLASVALTMAAGLMVTAGCSKKDGTATPVTLDNLKAPGSLEIRDLGNGKATLTWMAANNEKDFVGFNIYGIRAVTAQAAAGDDEAVTYTDLGVTAGEAIQLLGDDGKLSADAAAIINKFDYDPAADKPLEKAGTPPAAAADSAGSSSTSSSSTTASATPLINARPIATLSPEQKTILPSCQVADGACALTTAAKANDAGSANGAITFDLSTLPGGKGALRVGETYCFFVLSTMKGGSKVSAVTSNVACVAPAYETTFALTLPSTVAESKKFDLLGWLGTCAGGTCADPTAASSIYIVGDAGSHSKTDPGPLYFEIFGGTQTLNAGKNNSVLDLGYVADGFGDTTLPAVAPTLTLDSKQLFNGNGYSLPGQSVPLIAHHMYVVATADGTKDTAPTTYNYNWLYINSSDSDIAAHKATIVARLPAAARP